MEVFEFNKILLSIVGILPVYRIKKSFAQLLHKFRFYFFLINLWLPIFSCTAYIYGHLTDSSQILDIMMTFVAMSASFANIGSYISLAANEGNVKIWIDKLQGIVDEGNKQ